MSVGFDIWGVIAGVLGTLGLLPVLYDILRSQFPSTRFQLLHETFVETETLFRSVTEEGLLKDANFVCQTRDQLHLMHSQVEDFRAAIHRATTFKAEFVEMMRGLSRKISVLCTEIQKIRAIVSHTSAEERKRLLRGNSSPIHSTNGVTPLPENVYATQTRDNHRYDYQQRSTSRCESSINCDHGNSMSAGSTCPVSTQTWWTAISLSASTRPWLSSLSAILSRALQGDPSMIPEGPSCDSSDGVSISSVSTNSTLVIEQGSPDAADRTARFDAAACHNIPPAFISHSNESTVSALNISPRYSCRTFREPCFPRSFFATSRRRNRAMTRARSVFILKRALGDIQDDLIARGYCHPVIADLARSIRSTVRRSQSVYLQKSWKKIITTCDRRGSVSQRPSVHSLKGEAWEDYDECNSVDDIVCVVEPANAREVR